MKSQQRRIPEKSFYVSRVACTACLKSVQMQGYLWSVFSCIGTEYGDSITFHAVFIDGFFIQIKE